jgi:hypothetical protein
MGCLTNGMIGSLPNDPDGDRSSGHSVHHGTSGLNQRQPRCVTERIAWSAIDLFIELYIQTGNRVGFGSVTGSDIKETLENIVYAPLGGVQLFDYQGGSRRDLPANRIGELAYLGEDGVTPAGVDNPLMLITDGDQQSISPMLIPLTDFQPAPDLRPGGADVPDYQSPAVARRPPMLTHHIPSQTIR